MELKVWVDGIQRVICGVTESSTCQDVVYALAHATGQTGRFTLVEKWRNSERLLAPNEQPLKVLTKWGEYANDVHFLMRRSTTDNKQPSLNNDNQTQNGNKRQHDFLRSLSPSGNARITVSNKEIKKSLTFSCGHGSSGSVSSDNSTTNANSPQFKNHNRNIKNKSKQDLPKGVVRGVPQKPFQEGESPSSTSSRIERPKYPPSYDEAVSRSSGRFPTSHFSLPSTIHHDDESPSSKSPHLSARVETTAQERLPLSQTQNSSRPDNHKTQIIMDPVKDLRSTERLNHSPSRSPEKMPFHIIQTEENLKLKKGLLSPKIENDKQIASDTSSIAKKSGLLMEDTNKDPQYQDLVRLVSLQREKLDNQQSEITQFDAEIVYWEGRLQEQEERLGNLQEEVAQLERIYQEHEGELVQLERRAFSEEVELGRQEERTLRSELTLARSQLANCETELLQCRQRVRLLLEEMAEERRIQEHRHKEQEEQERLLYSQVQGVQAQLKEKTAETETQKAITEKAKEEIVELESKMNKRQQNVEKLMEDIREANLHSLTLIPAEEGKCMTEGNFYNRPGSTRKIIGSPRQLENAVPTNKNPHGVWV